MKKAENSRKFGPDSVRNPKISRETLEKHAAFYSLKPVAYSSTVLSGHPFTRTAQTYDLQSGTLFPHGSNQS
jgi:hypothetical protein